MVGVIGTKLEPAEARTDNHVGDSEAGEGRNYYCEPKL